MDKLEIKNFDFKLGREKQITVTKKNDGNTGYSEHTAVHCPKFSTNFVHQTVSF